MRVSTACIVCATAIVGVSAQTFQRLGACPTLGCVFPPDQSDFLPGQWFDIRLELHSPQNGSEVVPGYLTPDEKFTFTIAKDGHQKDCKSAASYFKIAEPAIERWNFTWYEDLFAQAAKTPSMVKVASKAYRKVALYEPGNYIATLTYGNGSVTQANWTVRDTKISQKAKNVIMFIGDGMTTNMITAARLIAHQSVNGKYQSRMAMDKFPVLGHQMTHSIDSFITDSANSATALYTGHKSSVNALGVYADSSPNPLDDPKIQSIAELFHEVRGGGVGIVSTAFIADATPGALTAHTRNRGQYGQVVDSFLNGVTSNYTWVNWTGPDVLFGGGAEQFIPSSKSFQGKDYYKEFQNRGYNLVQNNTALKNVSLTERALGIFSVSNMAKWLDRNVYKNNTLIPKTAPDGSSAAASDQPGLKEMTLKAIDILHKRNPEKGFFLMSEAASIDKMMHVLDYDRALGELLELDDTIKATLKHLEEIGELDETLIIVTADHGHGFDVTGGVDTKYMDAQSSDRKKRDAVGTYEQSGLSQYMVANRSAPIGSDQNLVYSAGVDFPVNWDPRYTLQSGLATFPDHRENYRVHKQGPRIPALNVTGFSSNDYYVNYIDAVTGFLINGTLPVSADQGVHSLTDVPVFAQGPCQSAFGGVYNNVDIFYNLATCLRLQRNKAPK